MQIDKVVCNIYCLRCRRCEFVEMRYFFLQVGDSLRMVCNFSLGTDQLYSVKWYKDNMEFYR